MYQLDMIRTAIFGIAAALLFMSSAMAQTVVDTTGSETDTSGDPTVVTGTETGTGDGTGTETDETVSAFDQLSPGGQKHTQSLFDAQQAGEGGEVMSLDDIAMARQETGWGNVFKQMKEDGLVLEKNFGQIVSGQGKIDTGKTDETIGNSEPTDTNSATATSASTGSFAKPRRTKLVVTTADGRRVVVGLKRPGPKSRTLAKGSSGQKAHGGGKVIKTATRGSDHVKQARVSTGHGKTTAGMTSRSTRIAISSGHGSRTAGNFSRGAGKKAGKVK